MFSATRDVMESQPTTSSSVQQSQPCRHFKFHEIQRATENFAESLVIGRGGFGKVYKGKLNYGSSIVVSAIKRLDSMSNQGATEFWAEVEMLSMLRHCNLVSLIGYCDYEKEMILVYEYMPNGTLDDHLHKLRTPLSWLQRLNICIGAARGLHYLHTGTGIQSGVIHRDVKSSNILLDETWAAKISDFGLSKIGPINQPTTYVNTYVKGTFGYFDPNYFTTGRLTRKSDVYAFGVVLLEVLCRKRAVDDSLDEDQWGLVAWVQDYIKEGNLNHVIDSDIRGEISPQCLDGFVKIAERCLHNSPKQRPTMAEVVVSLESVLALQERFYNSSQTTSGTILVGMANMFPSPSNREKYVQSDSKLSGNSNGNNMSPKIKEVPANHQVPISSVKEFSFQDLRKATRDFSLDFLLGEGRLGKVFIGYFDRDTFAPSNQGDGMAVAVKKLNEESRQGYAEWVAEVNVFGQLIHPNIVRFFGYCRDDQEHEHLIVYEYMPYKTLDRFLFTDDIAQPLSWETRLKIMTGVACGVAYLHSTKLIFRDLRSSRILLDEEFNAKIADFGLAKYGPETQRTHVTTIVKGTFGYIDPDYFMTGRLSMKSDVYCFGVMLLESMTARKAMDVNRTEESLVDWARSIQSNRAKLKKIMDPRLEHKYSVQGAFNCIALALRCAAAKPKDRPSSEEVLQTLEQIYAFDRY